MREPDGHAVNRFPVRIGRRACTKRHRGTPRNRQAIRHAQPVRQYL